MSLDISSRATGSKKGSQARAKEHKTESREPLQLFAQAQQNVITLNNSRLKALNDLKNARKTIAELQNELDIARQEIGRLQATAAVAVSATPQSTCDSADALLTTFVADANISCVDVTQLPECESNPVITITYQTAWPEAYIHCKVDAGEWTQPPGIRMSPEGGKKVVVLYGSNVEFVINNGANCWDKPDPYSNGGPENYTISAPGAYTLSRGVLWETM